MGNRVAPEPPGPPPHPSPPHDLSSRSLPLVDGSSLKVNWTRMSGCRHGTSLYWGKGRRYRFDDSEGQFGVMYVGEDAGCAFIETFGDSRSSEGRVEIAWRDLEPTCVWQLKF